MEKTKQIKSQMIKQIIKYPNGIDKILTYKKIKNLGKGGFAKCIHVVNVQSKEQYALKIVAKSTLSKSKTKQKLISEIKIHKALNNYNIVKFNHVFEDQQNVYMVLQLCSNNTLNELIKKRGRISQCQSKYFLVQIIHGIKFLHQNKIIHRDLKLGNLFLNDKLKIKIGDFGLASKVDFHGQKKKTICGTPNYIAPQILQSKGHSYEVDIWSIGVIMYIFLVGKPPFQTNQIKSTYRKIKQCSYTIPDYIKISEQAKDLIKKILVLDPLKRPTLQQIQKHPFLNNVVQSLPTKILLSEPQNSQIQNQIQQEQMINQNEKQLSQKREKIQNKFENQNQIYKIIHKYKENVDELKQKNEVYVKNYVDYSNKYGLGYVLSNGYYGVCFNDYSKIIVDNYDETIHYICKVEGKQSIVRYEKNQICGSKDLLKKVTLLDNFRNYLQKDNNKIKQKYVENSNICYVKKWIKTKNAIIFRLKNKLVQSKFIDNSEIIVSSQNKLVIYSDVKGQKFRYNLENALTQKNPQMVKRLKYTKEILIHMVNGG